MRILSSSVFVALLLGCTPRGFAETGTYFHNQAHEPWYLQSVGPAAQARISLGTPGACVAMGVFEVTPKLMVRVDPGKVLKVELQPGHQAQQFLCFELLDHHLRNPHFVRLLVVGARLGQGRTSWRQVGQLWLPSFLPAPIMEELRSLGPVERHRFVFPSNAYASPIEPVHAAEAFRTEILDSMEAGLGYWCQFPKLDGHFRVFASDLKVPDGPAHKGASTQPDPPQPL